MPVLQFKGKSVIETYHHTVPHHRLEFDAKLSLLPKGAKPSLDGNLIIEGDNLLALKALLPTHAGKVKCVYIDPPYNTGNEGWVYNDNLTQPQFREWLGRTVGKEGEDATRHDKWCCMMYPRLQLLKELLREDGSIWISIDDNEVHHLRMLMDEIFGPENFVAQVAVLCNPKGRVLSEGFAQTHEHLMVYSKLPSTRDFSVEKSAEQVTKEYELEDKGGFYRLLELRNTHRQFGKHNRPNLHYPLFIDRETGAISLKKHKGWTEVLPDWDDGFEGCWSWGREKVENETHLLLGKKTGSSWKVFRKAYANDPRKKPTSVWVEKEVQTEKGQSLLDEIMGGRVFYAPKAVGLLTKIIQAATEEDDLILDSFAGSGTTAHAVLTVNQEDGGNRKFLLVQMPHDTKEDQAAKNNICRSLTLDRVGKVIRGYSYKVRNDSGVRTIEVPGLGGSFTYIRVGEPLFGEYRDFGKTLPSFEELAKYVFYTETSRECDLEKIDRQTGLIGRTEAGGGTSYYLLYTQNKKEDRELSTETLKALARKDKARNWVVYCEKVWLHGDQLRKFEQEHGKRIRAMLVPFQLK